MGAFLFFLPLQGQALAAGAGVLSWWAAPRMGGGIDLSLTTKNEVQYIGFNQDQSCFAVGTSTGFKVFNCSPFKEVRPLGEHQPLSMSACDR